MAQTKHTFCRICEAACGLTVSVEDNMVTKIRPDREHVVTDGFACVKGIRFGEVQNSPDRVTSPLKRVGDRWVEIEWDQALGEIGAKIRALVDAHGPDALATYIGNPTGFSTLAPFFVEGFMSGIGSSHVYSSASVDCNNKFRVSQEMYGSPYRLTVPDVENTRLMILVGANPAVSQLSFVQISKAVHKLREIVKRGGRVVHVNPRRTETADAVGGQVFIRPGTDVYFLAAFCNALVEADAIDRARVERYMVGFEQLAEAVAEWTPERTEPLTRVPAATLRELAAAFAAADGACLYAGTGLNQGPHGTLAFWLLEAANAISGNLDRRGGTFAGRGLLDLAAIGKRTGRFERPQRTRNGDIPSISDTFPVGVLADEILREAPDRVRGLVVQAGNPLLSCPNPDGRLEEALNSLELVVSVDLFRNETANLAHYILPGTTFLERADLPMILQTFAGTQLTRYTQYTAPVVDAPDGARDEWWIYTRLARASGGRLFGSRLANLVMQASASLARTRGARVLALTPERMIGLMLRAGRAGSRKKHTREHTHGRLLEPNRAHAFLGTNRVLTASRKLQLAPADFVQALDALTDAIAAERDARDTLRLVTKRERRGHNSWMHNSAQLSGPDSNYVYVHPDDADRIGIRDGDAVVVESKHGSVTVPAVVSDEIMKGAVALPHGWGHARADGLSIASKNAGVNANLLSGDGPDSIERLSGNAHLTAIHVDLRKELDRR